MTTHTAFVPCIDFSERLIAEIRLHCDCTRERGATTKMPLKTREPAIREEWAKRFDVMRHDGLPPKGTCWQCRRPGLAHLDRAHIVARCLGGTDHPGNLWMLCKTCHKDTEVHDVWYKVHAIVDPYGCIADDHMITNLHWYRVLSVLESAWQKGRMNGIFKGRMVFDEPEDRVSMLDDETLYVYSSFLMRVQHQDNPYGQAVAKKWLERICSVMDTAPHRRGLLFDL